VNPVAVLINKAMIEFPSRFAGKVPVNPKSRGERRLVEKQWHEAQGLAEDVRYYGQWVRDEAEKRIGYLYPKSEITSEMAKERPDLKPLIGQRLPVIAWLWARTVRSPNPAFRHVHVPLASTFILSSKKDKDAYVQPVVEGDVYHFRAKLGPPPPEAEEGTKLARGNFRCLLSGTPISTDYIKAEAQAGRMGARLLAVVAEGARGRAYLSPTAENETLARGAHPQWKPDVEFFKQALGFRIGNYGMSKWSDLFTSRQLLALTTFTDLLCESYERIERDAIAAGMQEDIGHSGQGGAGASAYAKAVGTYLAFLISQVANHSSSVCGWNSVNTQMRSVFARQALPMVWDYAESNPFCDSSGSFNNLFERQVKGFEALGYGLQGIACQADANCQSISKGKIVSTDPPYYDNIGYADLSDFFYVWLRRSLRSAFPDLFATVSVPKDEELVATPGRHGGAERAAKFFLGGMTRAMHCLAEQAHPVFPVTIYYAFKQADEANRSGTASKGWETFLDAVIRAGFSINGTWPTRTEKPGRMRENDSNALASSIVLVCRPRQADAATVSRRAFLRELNHVLPEALDEMTRGAGEERAAVAPVDLSQSIIGPGMAVFSKYAAVLEADGSPMTVRTALTLINRFVAEDDFDQDTQFCLHWFEQHGWEEGKFGEADTLARAKGTSVDGVKRAGVLYAVGGVVRLLKWAEYPDEWEPESGPRLPVWEVLHQLIRILKAEGESGAGAMLAAVQAKAEATRQLAYRLYTLCERAGWAEDARAYNEIITSWPAIESAAARVGEPEEQEVLFEV
jgi:putative DNA methylase